MSSFQLKQGNILMSLGYPSRLQIAPNPIELAPATKEWYRDTLPETNNPASSFTPENIWKFMEKMEDDSFSIFGMAGLSAYFGKTFAVRSQVILVNPKGSTISTHPNQWKGFHEPCS